jgi:hypothetical protein
MEPSDVFGLTLYLANLYGDRFPALTDGMARLWYESLRHLDADIAHEAATRWARQHTLKAPSLDELLEQIDIVRDDQRQARRSGRSDVRALDVLRDAAETQAANAERSDDDATYGRLMVLLTERSIGPWQDSQGIWHEKLTQEQRGEQCYEWAEQYRTTQPQLAKDLEAAARQYLLTLPLQFGD